MEFIKSFVSKFLSFIDNGKFFIQPVKWLYVLLAYLSFLPVLVVLYYIYNMIDSGVFDYMKHLNTWVQLSAYLFCLLYVVFIVFTAFFMFHFWMNRSKKVSRVVTEGDQIVAMPVLAHLIQSLGESYGVYLTIVPPVGAALLYVWSIITGFKFIAPYGDVGDFFKLFFSLLLVLALFTIVCMIVGYFVILFSHYVGESIRVRAQIANDVRDLGDIHRAATLIREAETASVNTETEE